MTITTERLREIAEDGFLAHGESKELARALLAAREAVPDLVQGMEVSIDVSTCDADAEHRLFGMVTEVSKLDGAKNGYILLVQDVERNFTTPPAPALQGIDKQAIADRVYSKCLRIPGATFYNAAEFAIDEIGACLAAAMSSSAPPAPAAPEVGE